MPKSIKKFLKIASLVLLCVVLMLATILILLHDKKIQTLVAQVATVQLSEKVHSRVRIGKVEYDFFNNLKIKQIYIEDQKRDTLLYADCLNVHFSLWGFFRNEFRIRTLRLEGLYASIETDSAGTPNFRFLIDAFPLKQSKTPFEALVEAREVQICDGRIQFRAANARPHYADVFSVQDIYVTDLNATLALNALTADTLDAQIRALSFNERSGLRVNSLRTHFMADRTHALLPEMVLEMPHSIVQSDTVRLLYDSLPALSDWMHNLRFDGGLNAEIGLADLAPFVPAFRRMGGVADAFVHLHGTLANLKATDINCHYNGTPLLRGSMNINGLPELVDTYIYATVDELSLSRGSMQDFLADITHRPIDLPAELAWLGRMKYQGVITGFLTELVAYGTLVTNLGSIATDMQLQTDSTFQNLDFNGKISTKNFLLGRLAGVPDIGEAGFDMQVLGNKYGAAPVQGTLQGNVSHFSYKNYRYKDIRLDGNFSKGSFAGKMRVDDENLALQFDGLVDITQDLPVFNFELALHHCNLEKLHLIDKYPQLDIALNTTINMVGNSLDNLNGYMMVDSLLIRNADRTFALDNLSVTSVTSDQLTNFMVRSDLLTANFSGCYKYSTMGITLSKFLMRYMPSLIAEKKQSMLAKTTTNNVLDFYLYLKNADVLCNVLDLPVNPTEMATLKGSIDEPQNRFDLRLGIPAMQAMGLTMNKLTVNCDNVGDQLNVVAYVEPGEDEKRLFCRANVAAHNDSAYLRLNWMNDDSIVHRGQINIATSIKHVNGRPMGDIEVLPSQIVLADSLWNLYPSHIVFHADSTIGIHNFQFSSNSQSVHINGLASRLQTDSIVVDMQNLQLGYFLSFVNLNGITFGGAATGQGVLYGLLGQTAFDANVFLKDGQINGSRIGDVTGSAYWDRELQTVLINGNAVDGTDTVVVANGCISTARDSIDFQFDANGLDLSFLNYYTDNILLNIRGRGYGNVHLYRYEGTNGVRIAGAALAKDASLGIGYLGTRYYLNDTIRLQPTRIGFDSIALTDAEGHRALLQGELTHSGLFKDLKYKIHVDCENLLAMNTTAADNGLYYGRVYASGMVDIQGDEHATNINVNARTMPKTQLCISIASATTVADNNFINFVSHQPIAKAKKTTIIPDEIASKLLLNLRVDATPDATVQLIIDPKTGDMITGRGTGGLRLVYPGSSDVKLYGTYTIESGAYTFTFQDVLRREFKIDRGSSLTWTGDPLSAQVNIRALYTTTASLADLDKTLAESVSRTSVPVNCVLNLTDNLMAPTIKFDIDLPNSEETVKQQVRNIINTDEMRNRQVLYLLVLNKFYTPEYMRVATGSVSSNDAYSLLTSTLSGQINNWISRLTNDFTFGFNVRTSDDGTTATQEYETEFLYQPNNRLIINGNIGYRNDAVSANKIMGDADVEYLLTQSGKLRAKAYTHTVDKYSLKTAQTIQGVGLAYSEDFNTVGEFFDQLWTNMRDIFRKDETKKQNKTKK